MGNASGTDVAVDSMSIHRSSNIASDGRVPDEGTPHAATWIGWPSSVRLYGKGLLRNVRTDISRLVATIANYEPVNVLINEKDVSDARDFLFAGENNCSSARFPVLVVSTVQSNDMWLRDTGPVFRVDSTNEIIDTISLNFNGWGNKQKHDHDKLVAAQISQLVGVPSVIGNLCGEGGGVECDGDGTLMATETCWINRNRNAGRTKEEVERELLSLYGATKMIWLPGVVDKSDITDDHVDGSVRFVAPGTVVLNIATAEDETNDDQWTQNIRRIKAILASATDARGRNITVIPITPPHPDMIRSKSKDILLSYCNFLIVNGAIISVEFGDHAADENAKAVLGQVFPGRIVELIPLDYLYCCGGGIHCATQHQPVAASNVTNICQC